MTRAGPGEGARPAVAPPPILPFRPYPDSGCWEHAAFVLWLLSHRAPRVCAGEGRLFAMARALAAHRVEGTVFVAGLPADDEPSDLLILDADNPALTGSGSAIARLGSMRSGDLALIGGADREALRAVPDSPGATTLGERYVLRLLRSASPAPDEALSPARLRAVAATCAAVNDGWLLRQRLAETAAENTRLRGELARRAIEPARAEARAIPVAFSRSPPAVAEAGSAAPTTPAPGRDDDIALQLARALARGGRMLPRPLRPMARAGVRGTIRFGRWGYGTARRLVWRRRARAVLRDTDFFDPDWYRARYPEIDASGLDPVDFFLRIGMWRRDEVSPRFSGEWYLARYPEIAAGHHHPLVHYLWAGQREGREIRDPPAAAARSEIIASGLFDPAWYASRDPALQASGQDPLDHFLAAGMAARAETSPHFDGARYLAENPDVDASGMHPLIHYLRFGRNEGRIAHARAASTAAPRAPGADARAFGLQLSPATLFRVTVGLVAPPGLDVDLLRRATAAVTEGLSAIGQNAADRILVLDQSGRLGPAILAEWPAALLPPRGGASLAAAHNHLADIAFAQGADIHVVLSARGVLRDGALTAMIRMVRAGGRQVIVGAVRAATPGAGLDPASPPWLASPAIAIPKAAWRGAGGFDPDFAAAGADIDFSWRARAKGFLPMLCPEAMFEDEVGAEPGPTGRLAGAWMLARKWHLPALETAAAREIEALGFPCPLAAGPRPAALPLPHAPPSLDALIPPW